MANQDTPPSNLLGGRAVTLARRAAFSLGVARPARGVLYHVSWPARTPCSTPRRGRVFGPYAHTREPRNLDW